ncbi:hypothetical protein B0T14DRAFT_569613 [Immersiella caudata]|uniref:PNPLA domain-containing protein n=1 Tax=Immersiella caudata TaxID=314043 RepID=A0AA39WDU8_9PEZI|nr:hypothetical protein B0T14DRAFT_569613 [Immersiella caudata]
MATSAVTYYLPCFEKPEQTTSYVDGAVWTNCPAQVAYAEMEKLWPGDPASLDALMSLGTGMQDVKPFEMPALVNMGFLAAIRAVLKRQMDSKATWLNFVTETALPLHLTSPGPPPSHTHPNRRKSRDDVEYDFSYYP